MLASPYAVRTPLGAGRHEIPTTVGAWIIKSTRLMRCSIRILPVTQPEITPSRADIMPRLVPVWVLTVCCIRGTRASTASNRCASPRTSIGIGITGLSQSQRRCHAKHRQRQSQGLSQRSYHSFFSFSKEVIFLRRLASSLAPLPRGLRLLTPVRVQTVCQRSRAAGVLVFHHVGQPMPHAVVGACEALGTQQARGSRAPPYYRRHSASRANRCDDVVSPGQHVVSAPRHRTPPRGLPWGDGRGTGGGTGQKARRGGCRSRHARCP